MGLEGDLRQPELPFPPRYRGPGDREVRWLDEPYLPYTEGPQQQGLPLEPPDTLFDMSPRVPPRQEAVATPPVTQPDSPDNPQVVTIKSPDASIIAFWRNKGYKSVPGMVSPEGYPQMVRSDVAPLYTNPETRPVTVAAPPPVQPQAPGPLAEGHVPAVDEITVPNEKITESFIANMKEGGYELTARNPTASIFKRFVTETSGESPWLNQFTAWLERKLGRKPTPEELDAEVKARGLQPGEQSGRVAQFEPKVPPVANWDWRQQPSTPGVEYPPVGNPKLYDTPQISEARAEFRALFERELDNGRKGVPEEHGTTLTPDEMRRVMELYEELEDFDESNPITGRNPNSIGDVPPYPGPPITTTPSYHGDSPEAANLLRQEIASIEQRLANPELKPDGTRRYSDAVYELDRRGLEEAKRELAGIESRLAPRPRPVTPESVAVPPTQGQQELPLGPRGMQQLPEPVNDLSGLRQQSLFGPRQQELPLDMPFEEPLFQREYDPRIGGDIYQRTRVSFKDTLTNSSMEELLAIRQKMAANLEDLKSRTSEFANNREATGMAKRRIVFAERKLREIDLALAQRVSEEPAFARAKPPRAEKAGEFQARLQALKEGIDAAYHAGDMKRVIDLSQQLNEILHPPHDEFNRGYGPDKDEPTFARVKGGGLTASVDIVRAVENITKDYTSPLPGIMNREGMQNALDAADKLGENGEVKVRLTHDNEIEIYDNGSGLDEDALANKLVEIFATGKEGEAGATGGKGIGSASYIYGGEHFEIRTVAIDRKDGVKYEIIAGGTPEQFLDPVKGSDWDRTPVPPETPTGTTMKVKLKDEQDISYARDMITNIVENSRNRFSRVVVDPYSYSGRDPLSSIEPDGNTITEHRFRNSADDKMIGDFTTTNRNSKVQVLIPEFDPNISRESIDVHYLNNGMYQFSKRIDLDTMADGVPDKVLVDIHPLVDDQDELYPFINTREDIKNDIRDEVNRIYQREY